MKKRLLIPILTFLVLPLPAAEPRLEALPAPISNNAVASLKISARILIYSFMGIGRNKTWKDVSSAAYEMDMDTGKWDEIHPVPGPAGRLAASAAGAREQVFLFGGYVIDAQGGEQTVPDVNVYEPRGHRWYRGADIPVPVDDSVIGTYHDRYIYLIGGWSNGETVRDVQVYDSEKNTWYQATPITGTPVFGHAGAILNDTIIYVDGASKNPAGNNPRYIASDQCWMGRIDHHDPTKIQWSKIANHPGDARYRIAAGASEKEHRIYFSGGTQNPYNYNGVGYDGRPSEPSAVSFAWNVHSGKWEVVNENTPDPVMDQRTLVATPAGLIIIGGMEKAQQVSSRVTLLPKTSKKR